MFKEAQFIVMATSFQSLCSYRCKSFDFYAKFSKKTSSSLKMYESSFGSHDNLLSEFGW